METVEAVNFPKVTRKHVQKSDQLEKQRQIQKRKVDEKLVELGNKYNEVASKLGPNHPTARFIMKVCNLIFGMKVTIMQVEATAYAFDVMNSSLGIMDNAFSTIEALMDETENPGLFSGLKARYKFGKFTRGVKRRFKKMIIAMEAIPKVENMMSKSLLDLEKSMNKMGVKKGEDGKSFEPIAEGFNPGVKDMFKDIGIELFDPNSKSDDSQGSSDDTSAPSGSEGGYDDIF